MEQATAESMQGRAPDPISRAPRRAIVASAVAAAIMIGLLLGACGSDDGRTDQPPDGSGAAPASFFGVVPQDLLTAPDFEEMAKAGVGTLRIGLYWQQAQAVDGSSYDFTNFDDSVRAAAENGIAVFPFLYGLPDWVAKGLDGRSCSDCRTYAPQSAAALAAWRQFASTAAGRYGPGGAFWEENPDVPEVPIRSWQIWNEQNSKLFYKPNPDPVLFEKLLSNASEAIRAEDPQATIVLGGMFGTPAGGDPGHAIAAATFLRELLQIDGAKSEFDGYALHPYSGSVDFVRRQVEISRREMRRSHYPGASLWVSEIGWASGGKKTALNVGSQKAQAERVTEAYRLFEEHREAWNVKLVAWFAWEDSHASDDLCFFCAKAGLTNEQGEPKPSLEAYERVASSG